MCAEAEAQKNGGETGLTEALEHVMKADVMYAFVPDGESFDIGNAKAYRDTFTRFGL